MDSEPTEIRWNVAIDGSTMSKAAYNQVLDHLMHTNDHLIVSHVYNLKKTYLPKHMQYKYMQQVLEAEISGRLDAGKFNLCFEERDASISTKE